VPFSWSGLTPTAARDRQANSEHMRVQQRASRAAPPPQRSLADLRHAILNGLDARADPDSGFYDPAALALLDQFEAALRESWNHAERGFARQRAEDAIRGAVGALADGHLV
jgi:hypothetical protein